jgi:hypothetical protein
MTVTLDFARMMAPPRVNSLRRLAYAASIGCDSIDGTQWVRFRDTYLRQGLQACAAGAQLRLDTHAA